MARIQQQVESIGEPTINPEPTIDNPEPTEPMRENERLGVSETLITHPFRHLFSPGWGNKLEAFFGVLGRGALVYGGTLGSIAIYKLGAKLLTKKEPAAPEIFE